MKKLVVMGVLLLMLCSFMVIAEEDSCSGFFGTIKCVLWGDPSVRANLAGEAFERNLVGYTTFMDVYKRQTGELLYVTKYDNKVYKKVNGLYEPANINLAQLKEEWNVEKTDDQEVYDPKKFKYTGSVADPDPSYTPPPPLTKEYKAADWNGKKCVAETCYYNGQPYNKGESITDLIKDENPGLFGSSGSSVDLTEEKAGNTLFRKNQETGVWEYEDNAYGISTWKKIPENGVLPIASGSYDDAARQFAKEKVVTKSTEVVTTLVAATASAASGSEKVFVKADSNGKKVYINLDGILEYEDGSAVLTGEVAASVEYNAIMAKRQTAAVVDKSNSKKTVVATSKEQEDESLGGQDWADINYKGNKKVGGRPVKVIDGKVHFFEAGEWIPYEKEDGTFYTMEELKKDPSFTAATKTTYIVIENGKPVQKELTFDEAQAQGGKKASSGITYAVVDSYCIAGFCVGGKIVPTTDGGKKYIEGKEKKDVPDGAGKVTVKKKSSGGGGGKAAAKPDGTVKKFQNDWIKKNCNSDSGGSGSLDCSKKDVCIGTIKSGKCIGDGIEGTKTKEAKAKMTSTKKEEVPSPSPIVNGVDNKKAESNKLDCKTDGEKCLQIINSFVGEGQLQAWKKENKEIDWSQVELYKPSDSYPEETTLLEKGKYFTVHFTNKESAVIRQPNKGLAIVEFHTVPVKGKDGKETYPLKEISYIMGGQVVASQSAEEAGNGKVTVNGQSYFVDSSKPIEEVLAAKEGGKLGLYATKEERDAAAKDPKSVKPTLLLETSGVSGSAGTGSANIKTTEFGILTDTATKMVLKDGKKVGEETTYDDAGIAGRSGTFQEKSPDGTLGRLLQIDQTLQTVGSGDDAKKVVKDSNLFHNGAKVGAEHYGDDGKLEYSWKKNTEGKVEVTYKGKTQVVSEGGKGEAKTTVVVTAPKEEEKKVVIRTAKEVAIQDEALIDKLNKDEPFADKQSFLESQQKYLTQGYDSFASLPAEKKKLFKDAAEFDVVKKKEDSRLDNGFYIRPELGVPASQHDYTEVGLSFKGAPVVCDGLDCRVYEGGYKSYARRLSTEEMQDVIAADSKLGSKEKVAMESLIAKRAVTPLINNKPGPGVAGAYAVQTGDYSVVIALDTAKGKKPTVQEAVQGTVPDAVDNPEKYDITIEGMPVVLVDGKYYSKDLVTDGKVDKDTPEVTFERPDAKVTVTRKLEEPPKKKEKSAEKTAEKKEGEGDILLDVQKKALDEAEEAEKSKATQDKILSVYKFANQIKSYPAISQALYGDAEWYQNWRDNADRAFAPMLGSSWFPSAVCDEEGFKRDIESNEGVAFVKTPSGTYQAVAAVKGERTKELSPLLCARNPDETEKELFICGEGQVCMEDQLCYADADEDGEADIKKGKKVAEPLNGYMYKISWAVTAPGDEKLTPFVTEKGGAIAFNIFIDKDKNGKIDTGAVGIYNSLIELKNGEHDADVLTQFEKDDAFKEVCIGWDRAPATTPSPFSGVGGGLAGTGGAIGAGVAGTAVAGAGSAVIGGALSAAGGITGAVRFLGNAGGADFGREMIPAICSQIKDSAVGTVVWTPTDEKEKSDTPSPTVSSGKIGKKGSWS